MAMIDTIVALLAKAERTDNEHERDAYLAKAQELQTKYAIEQGMLDAARPQQEREAINQMRFCEERNTPLIKAKRQLVLWLADVNNCFVILGHRRAYLEVTGHQSDLVMVQHLYASILLQMQRAMQQAEGRGDVVGALAGWRVSYAHGYVRRVAVRLLAAKTRQMAETSTGTPGSALVLVNRAEVAKQAAEGLYGDLKKARKIPNSDNNEFGRYAGNRDGHNADLGGDRIGAATTRRELS
jgi:hypothetical protein